MTIRRPTAGSSDYHHEGYRHKPIGHMERLHWTVSVPVLTHPRRSLPFVRSTLLAARRPDNRSRLSTPENVVSTGRTVRAFELTVQGVSGVTGRVTPVMQLALHTSSPTLPTIMSPSATRHALGRDHRQLRSPEGEQFGGGLPVFDGMSSQPMVMVKMKV